MIEEKAIRRSITMTLREVNAETGIPIRTIRKYIEDGLLRATKPGKIVLVFTDSLMKLLKRNELAS